MSKRSVSLGYPSGLHNKIENGALWSLIYYVILKFVKAKLVALYTSAKTLMLSKKMKHSTF